MDVCRRNLGHHDTNTKWEALRKVRCLPVFKFDEKLALELKEDALLAYKSEFFGFEHQNFLANIAENNPVLLSVKHTSKNIQTIWRDSEELRYEEIDLLSAWKEGTTASLVSMVKEVKFIQGLTPILCPFSHEKILQYDE